MAGALTARPRGRPPKPDAKGPYIPHTDYPATAIRRVCQDLDLDDIQTRKVTALATSAEARIAGLSAIAAGIGFRNPDTHAAMRARIHAFELLLRVTGMLDGYGKRAGPSVAVQINNGTEGPQVTFIRPELDPPQPTAADPVPQSDAESVDLDE